MKDQALFPSNGNCAGPENEAIKDHDHYENVSSRSKYISLAITMVISLRYEGLGIYPAAHIKALILLVNMLYTFICAYVPLP